MTRRALVLTDETARHPFLKTLPPHVRRIAPEMVATKPVSWRISAGDLRDFLMAYCAMFLAVSIFLL